MIPQSKLHKSPFPRNYGSEFLICDHGKGCYIYDPTGKKYLDFGSEDPDWAVEINGARYGQWGTTIGAVIAQQITAELYNYFMEKEGAAPVLLSANLNGSDKHNNDLVVKYGGKRIR